jgi:very-short-patch-repair endonuclease
MRIYDANSWELYQGHRPPTSYYGRGKEATQTNTRTKFQKERVQAHNDYMKIAAEKNAKEMQQNPSELERKMQEFLDNQGIDYDFQRIFYIKDRNGYIKKYYIADFYVMARDVIIETDGQFHNEQVEHDEYRAKIIQHHYPNTDIIRWKWHDFESYKKMKELISHLK